MALPLPQLDNWTYADLVEQARARIPTLYPAWTDHNPTDPGIILLELLAWLTEMVLYRVNQVPEAHYLSFLQLLTGSVMPDDPVAQALPTYRALLQAHTTSAPPEPTRLQAAIAETMVWLHTRYRAVTATDLATLVLQQWPHTPEAQDLGPAGVVKRLFCLPQRDLERTGDARLDVAAGHVSLVILPDTADQTPQPSAALCRGVWRFLEPRRLLTTRHHVVGPDYLPVHIRATLYLEAGIAPQGVQQRAVNDLQAFFHPLRGPTGQGWPFGRAVYLSDVYDILAHVPGVDFVRAVQLTAPSHTEREQDRDAQQRPRRIALAAHELVAIEVSPVSFTTMERRGGTWQKSA